VSPVRESDPVNARERARRCRLGGSALVLGGRVVTVATARRVPLLPREFAQAPAWNSAALPPAASHAVLIRIESSNALIRGAPKGASSRLVLLHNADTAVRLDACVPNFTEPLDALVA
jgi:hypothetical protein